MLKILIVEDDRQLATTLKYLVEDNPRYRVVAIADDLDSAVAAAAEHGPELALGEDIMRGREALRPKMPVNLTLYDQPEDGNDDLEPGFIPSKRSFKTRLEHWIAGTQH